ncbi:phage tail protein [Plesiomonas shigelloides]|nr:phage tail protein [Plesiomonas shigelloides]
MQAESCLSEIAALGEEAKHNARQNLGVGNAAVMDVQQDIYDRTAGRAALPGAFGFGHKHTSRDVVRFNSDDEFLTWARYRAYPGEYIVSGNKIIPDVVFNGVVNVKWIEPSESYTRPENVVKAIVFYGTNGDIYFNRYWPTGNGVLIGWEKWKLKIDDFTRALRSGESGSNWRYPGVGGLVLAAYQGQENNEQSITLSRLEAVKGSRLSPIDITVGSRGEVAVFCASVASPLPGLYTALSGYGGASSGAWRISLFMRIE